MFEKLVKRLQDFAAGTMRDEDAKLAFDAVNAIEELQGRVKVLEKVADKWCAAVPKWIPVTERLPSNGTNVLVLEFGRVEQAYTTTYTADRSLCWVVINGGSYHRISDADCPIKWWMPLPTPPKEE